MQEKTLDFTFGGYGEGVHYNLPDEEYHKIGAVSSHMVISAMKSLKKAHSYFHETFEPTPAFELGRLTHLAILEPDRYKELVFHSQAPMKTLKAYKADVMEHADKKVLSLNEWTLIEDMKKAVYASAIAPKTLLGGRTEVTVFAIHPELKIPLKGRIDYVSKKEDYLLDYKTAAQVEWPFFERASATYGYHLQAKFYLMLMNLMGKKIEHYFVLAQEKSSPYDTIVYKFGMEALDKAEELINDLLPMIEESFRTGIWPGYSDDYEVLSLPDWAFNQKIKRKEL